MTNTAAPNCPRCLKWRGAHATLPGQSRDHLCNCPPERQAPAAWLRSDGMKAMTADEKTAWLEAGRADLVADYTIPLRR